MTYPRQIETLGVDWLNQVLIEKKALTHQRITSFSHVPVPKQGMTSLAHIITPVYDQRPDGAPKRLLAKFSLDHPLVKEAMGINRGFEREVAFYQTFGEDPGIPTPRCYAAEYDGDENSCMLLMEYVENTCERDVMTGSPADVALAVRHLAGFHAKWWNKEEVLADIYPQQVSFLLDTYVEKLSAALDNIRTRYADQVGRTLISLLELWLPNARLIDKRFQQGHRTVCHGDCHRNQFLFPVSENDPFCLIDWQLTCKDPGPTDLAHIIMTGLLPEQRRERETEMVATYHALLAENGVTGYSLEDTWADYKLGMVKIMLFYLCAFEIGDVAPILDYWKANGIKGVSFWDASFKWPSLALEDNGAVDFLARLIPHQ